jgi:hypothetical protein
LHTVVCALFPAVFSHNKEKAMPIEGPPPIEQIAQQLATRLARDGARAKIAVTIPANRGPCPSCVARSERSRRHCHMPAQPKPRKPGPRDTGAYVPEMAARVDNDLNLTDGARRCARKIAEYVYRKNREGREAQITVTYLMKALGRCRRTVQRYLRQLEREGYIGVWVIPSERTRMCFGLLIRLLNPLLPRHRRHKWPQKPGKPDATRESQINSSRLEIRRVPRYVWDFLCSQGVWRSYMKTIPPLPSIL